MPQAPKKAIDREEMYKKIMPSAIRKEKEKEKIKQLEDNSPEETELVVDNVKKPVPIESVLQKKEIKWISDSDSEEVLYNITEKLVINRLDLVLKKMSGCRCDRCKKDIIAMSLNSLKPHYVVCQSKDVAGIVAQYEKYGLEVTNALLKAALSVRKNPQH